MSFDVFVQRFENGESVPLDHAAVLTALTDPSSAPSPAPDGGHLRLETDDGGADLHGLRPGTTALMLNHIDGTGAWKTIWTIAHATDAVIFPVGAPTIATSAEAVDQLPTELQQETILVADAGSLMRAATTS